MTSTNGRDSRIRELSREGWSVRRIARELDLSKSQVHRVLMASPLSTVVGGLGDDEDDDEDVNGLALFDETEESWPPEPFTFVGWEQVFTPGVKGDEGRWVTVDRWVDGNECSMGDVAPLTLYRYRMYVAHELDDPERADALATDWARQIKEYDARERARRT